MPTVNMFRGILVAGAVLAVVVAAAYQQWAAVAILTVGIAAHAALWVQIHRRSSGADTAAANRPGQPPVNAS